jgi:hypothetical protein
VNRSDGDRFTGRHQFLCTSCWNTVGKAGPILPGNRYTRRRTVLIGKLDASGDGGICRVDEKNLRSPTLSIDVMRHHQSCSDRDRGGVDDRQRRHQVKLMDILP